jgi:iron complex outermembrane recepter protein
MKIFQPKVFIFLTLLNTALFINAQNTKSKINGIILGPDNEPALFSTIVLLNSDSVFLKGTLSQQDGSFQLEDISQGTYLIMVRNVEFETWYSQPLPLRQNENFKLEPVILRTRINVMDEVEITGRKALVEVHPDKMVFNVTGSVNASGNNALELLSKAPGVFVDMDKNVVLQGKSGVLIYINGRPSRLSGSDLTNMLEGLRSDNIDAVEIITNPSAKYDAEGSAGIINLVMKKNQSVGMNGNLITGFSKGKYGRANIGSALNYSGEKIAWFTNANLSEDNFQQDFEEITIMSDYNLDMISGSRNNRKGLNFSGGVDYNLSSDQSLSFDARALLYNRDNRLTSNTAITNFNTTIPKEFLDAEAIEKSPSGNYTFNLNYQYTPNNRTKISSDLSLGTFSSVRNTLQPNDYLDDIDGNIIRSVNTEFDSDTYIDLWSAMLDYEKKFKIITLSAGLKYSYIQTDNQFSFYNIENGNPLLDINRSNDFGYLEKIAATYLIVNIMPSEKLSLNAGLRVENTASSGELQSEIPILDSEVSRNYTDIFPNFGISYNDQKNSVLSVSYGRRVTRPNYQYLNPFESRLSELSSWKGNPFLKPNYITNYQISYAFKRKLVISNTYSITKDLYANIFEITEGQGYILTPRNMDRSTNNGLSLSYPQSVTKWWDLSAFLIYNYATYKGNMISTNIDLQAHVYNVRLQNSFRIPGAYTVELTGFYSSPWIWRGTVQVEDYFMLNFGVKKEFLKKKLLVQITASDLFRGGSEYYYKSNYGGMDIDGVIIFDNQRVGFTATYNFGNQQAKGRKRSRSAIDEELRRIGD